MSVSQHRLNYAEGSKSGLDSVDWISVVDSFGSQHDMTFHETLRWISNRTSLQVACEILGVALSPSIAARYTYADLEILYSLGDLLFEHEFGIPRLMEHRRLEYVQKGRESVGFSLSREEYLLERAKGKSKNRIAHQQGISGPALFHWLNKWGLKDSEVEHREIDALLESQVLHQDIDQALPEGTPIVPESCGSESPAELLNPSSPQPSVTDGEVSSGQLANPEAYVIYPKKLHLLKQVVAGTHQDPSDNEVEPGPAHTYTSMIGSTINVPVVVTSNRAEMSDALAGASNLSRDDLMQAGLQMIQQAVSVAYADLVALLGEPAAREQIQQYVINQTNKFMKELHG